MERKNTYLKGLNARETSPRKKDNTGRVFLSSEGVAERYGVSRKTVSNWVYRNQIPYIKKPGHRVMFRISELEAWEEDGHVRPR